MSNQKQENEREASLSGRKPYFPLSSFSKIQMTPTEKYTKYSTVILVPSF
jgi:hypothetical protein